MGFCNINPSAMKGIKTAANYIFSYKNGVLADIGEKAYNYYDENGY